MGMGGNGKLDLMRLKEGKWLAISEGRGAAMAEAAAVCFENQGHSNGVLIAISGAFNARYEVYWPSVTDKMLAWSSHDLQDATEEAACGVACMLAEDLTDYTIARKSKKGSGIDFWLARKDSFLFQGDAARLEVSGILKGNSSVVRSRLHKKIEQVKRSDNTGLPVYIIIVEFGSPLSLVMEK